MKTSAVKWLACILATTMLYSFARNAPGFTIIPLPEPEPEEPTQRRRREEPPVIVLPPEEPPTSPADVLGKTATAFPYSLARVVRDMIGQLPGRRWEFNVAYEEIEYLDITGDSWLFVGGHERTYSPWGWGFLVPAQRWRLDGFDDYWQIGVIPYAFVSIGDIIRVGGFGEVDTTISDIEGLDDGTSWAAGAFVSAPIPLGSVITVTPVGIYEHYWTGQEAFSDSDLFTVGSKLDFALGNKIIVGLFGFYTIENENDEIDDSYWEYGAMLTYFVKETWGFSFGYQGIEDAEDLEYDKYFLGAHLNF